MAKTFNKTESKEISSLIDINKDACEFYDMASQRVEDAHLKSTFIGLKSVHNGVLTNLQALLQSRPNEGDSTASQTLVGHATKFWGDLMTKVSNDVDDTLIAHLEEAENRCLHSMEETIELDNVTPDVKMHLRRELNTLQKTHEYMKEMKLASNK